MVSASTSARWCWSVHEKGKLVHAGQVGTGFNDRTIREIYQKMKPLVVEKAPFRAKMKIPRDVTWIKPELVCQVRFQEWTPDGQLRAPSFQGLRNDVDPATVRRETADCEPEPEPVPAAASSHQALLVPDQKEALLPVGRQTLKFTNLGKIFYPKEGFTKRDVINYYDAVAEFILPHLRDRPLSLKRYPNGIEAEYFFQKKRHRIRRAVDETGADSERKPHHQLCDRQ